ncbi:MAG: alanine racemase [Bacteriovoracaceae bacterium]|nr:alanine racemase [Bacteriovoracaceae bacterium]
MSDYNTYKTALKDQRLPAAVIDLDLLEQNAKEILKRAGSMRIRIATKSIRCQFILRHLLSLSPQFQGLMTFTAEETLFLAKLGFDDLLMGYPTTDLKSVKELASLNKKVTFMVDSKEHIKLLASLNLPLRICLDIDMSTPFPGIWFGVRRSPLRTLKQVQELLSDLPKNIKVAGVMGYEAQVAGVGDHTPQVLMNPVIRRLQRHSRKDYAKRRGVIVEWLRANHAIEFSNGGGTGSIEWSISDPGVDEITVGSGFYSPGLFDHYRRFKHSPAAFFALPLVRKPGVKMWTALGGGYIASGEINLNKRPVPFLPEGMALIDQEGAGEVQTPIHYEGPIELQLGDPVFFRHSKAGELCERFKSLLLLRAGKIENIVPTYRGEDQVFL